MGITPEYIDAQPNSERAVLEFKLEKLEKMLLREGSPIATFFTIAGSKLFEPDGSLSPKVVRCLGRRAGGVRAPSVSYDTSYEVGETAACHHWRKRTMACNTFEGLLYSLRFLDAHLDKAVTMTATAIVSRKANSIKANSTPATTAIRCVHMDPATGCNEYFIISQGKKQRGTWHLEESVDLSSLIHYRFAQKRWYAGRKEQLMREKIKKNNRKEQEKTNLVVKREQLEKERKLKAVTALKMASKTAGVKRKIPATTCLSSIKAKPQQPAKKVNNDVFSFTNSSPRDKTAVLQKQVQFEAACRKHCTDTKVLLKASAARGDASVSPEKMAERRSKNLAAMRATNLQAHKTGAKLMSEQELTQRMSEAESEAVKLYLKELQQMTQSRGGGSAPKKMKPKTPPAKKRKATTQVSTDGLKASPSTKPQSSSSMATAKHINAPTTKFPALVPPNSSNLEGVGQQLPSAPQQRKPPAQDWAPIDNIPRQQPTSAQPLKAGDRSSATPIMSVSIPAENP